MTKGKMAFDLNACLIPTFWCGKGAVPASHKSGESRYSRAGSSYECMQQGFGAGSATERTKRLPRNSLQHIRFIGETYEANFARENINTTTDLVREMRGKRPQDISRMLKRVLTKSNGSHDKKAFNSVLMYLYRHGNGDLPQCSRFP